MTKPQKVDRRQMIDLSTRTLHLARAMVAAAMCEAGHGDVLLKCTGDLVGPPEDGFMSIASTDPDALRMFHRAITIVGDALGCWSPVRICEACFVDRAIKGTGPGPCRHYTGETPDPVRTGTPWVARTAADIINADRATAQPPHD